MIMEPTPLPEMDDIDQFARSRDRDGFIAYLDEHGYGQSHPWFPSCLEMFDDLQIRLRAE